MNAEYFPRKKPLAIIRNGASSAIKYTGFLTQRRNFTVYTSSKAVIHMYIL